MFLKKLIFLNLAYKQITNGCIGTGFKPMSYWKFILRNI